MLFASDNLHQERQVQREQVPDLGGVQFVHWTVLHGDGWQSSQQVSVVQCTLSRGLSPFDFGSALVFRAGALHP